MNENRSLHILYAILAALLFGLNIPVSKILIQTIPPLMMASLLYLGAGSGMLVVYLAKQAIAPDTKEAGLSPKDMPFIIMMVVLDIAAPVFLMLGLRLTGAGNAALIGNFEMAATSVIALIVFRETIGKRLWIAIGFITFASMMLTITDSGTHPFSFGSVFVLIACVCWGFENNCTRKLSIRDPLQVVIIKGFGSGFGSLIIALACQSVIFSPGHIFFALGLGFISYGLSLFFYVLAQRHLGAARTSSYFALAPFIGVALSFILLKEPITMIFIISLVVMAAGVFLVIFEHHTHRHLHKKTSHDHRHGHLDGHHNHTHTPQTTNEHSHPHFHDRQEHDHPHTPDLHHRHKD
jgi:drug/metabolite transporter (DMT)-like permease